MVSRTELFEKARKSGVIVGGEPSAHLPNLTDYLKRIQGRARPDGVRIHDLRHSFSSRALALGEGLPMIGKLLGHTWVQTTAGTHIWPKTL